MVTTLLKCCSSLSRQSRRRTQKGAISFGPFLPLPLTISHFTTPQSDPRHLWQSLQPFDQFFCWKMQGFLETIDEETWPDQQKQIQRQINLANTLKELFQNCDNDYNSDNLESDNMTITVTLSSIRNSCHVFPQALCTYHNLPTVWVVDIGQGCSGGVKSQLSYVRVRSMVGELRDQI